MPYKNPEKRREYARKWYKEHPEKCRIWGRKYYKKHREQKSEYQRKYRKEHPEKGKDYDRKYYKEHPEKHREFSRKYRRGNPEKIRECNRKWKKNHPEKCREYGRKRISTLKGRLDNRMRNLIWKSLKGRKAGRSWKSLVDYTLDQLKQHIEKLFTGNMNWTRFMAGEIHIDHKVPLSHFHYTLPDDPQFKKCWALHNLQPMWAKDNMSKGNRII